MTDPWYEVAFGDHYPLLYAHRDVLEAQRCLQLLSTLVPGSPGEPPLPVLDLGCGDGRHLPFLATQSAMVIGLDLSWSLLDLARKRLVAHPGSAISLVRADMRAIPLADGSCGRVLSLFTSFGYFGPLEGNAPVVAEVARVLAPGRPWCLDYLDCDRVRQELAPHPEGLRRERTLGPCHFSETRRLSPEEDMVIKAVTVSPEAGQETAAARYGISTRGLQYTERVALFTLSALDQLTSSLGFDRVASAGSYGGASLGTGDRWLLVYHKSVN